MAKRELSSTLRNLKFMQRATQREEKATAKEEEDKPNANANIVFPSAIKRKCVVIMEGEPHPGVIKGRMSFQSFNPSIDKMNEEVTQPEASPTCSSDEGRRTSYRENGSSSNGAETLDKDRPNSNANGDYKRKQAEVVFDMPETQYPNKSPKNAQNNQQSSPHNQKGSYKQQKHERPDWSVLRPPKSQGKRG